MEENLTALVGKIPGLLTLEFVACPFGSSTHDMALVSTFEKEEDISVYAKTPGSCSCCRYICKAVCDRESMSRLLIADQRK